MKSKSGLASVLRDVLSRAKLLSAGVALAVAGAVVFSLLPPLALERIVNRLTAGAAVPFRLAALYFALLAAAGLFDSAKEVLITVLGQRTTRGLRRAMCAKLSRLPAAYFSGNEPGVTASRFTNDVETVESLFTSGIISMFADACKVVGILAVIFAKSRGLGALLLLATPLLFAMTRAFQKRMLRAQLENRAAVGRVSNHVPETIRNIRMIHVFRRERYMARRYDEYIGESYRAVEAANRCDALYSPIIMTVSAALIAVMMVLAASGGEMQRFFGMSVGTAVAVIAYVGKVFDPLESIGMELQNIQSAVAGVRRIDEYLAEPERAEADPSLTCARLLRADAPRVEFDGVRFAYAPGVPVLRGLRFSVGAGESVTLVGRTGAGKSTAFKLILGLYSPQGGHVRVCGAEAARIPDGEKRRLFGYVEQSFRMVPGTVLEQITLFDPAVSRADAEQAARMVGLHDSILGLARGYATPCAEPLFSQGQWQLLSIARAVAADPAILLLDEITANLDSETEERVLAALRRASENRTVLSISHRLYERTGGRRIDLDGGGM